MSVQNVSNDGFDLTRKQAMALLCIKSVKVFKRDFGDLPSRARTAKRPQQRMYRRSDLMRRRAELDPQGVEVVAEPQMHLEPDMEAFRRRLKQQRIQRYGVPQ